MKDTKHLVFLKEQHENLMNTELWSRGYVLTQVMNDINYAITHIETARNQKTFIGDGPTELDSKILAMMATVLNQHSQPKISIIGYHNSGEHIINAPQFKELLEIKDILGKDYPATLSELLLVSEEGISLAYPKKVKKEISSTLKKMHGDVQENGIVTAGYGKVGILYKSFKQDLVSKIKEREEWFLKRLNL